MRALKTILIIVAALIGLLIILGLVGPSSYSVERSTVIAAPAENVYRYVSHLSKMKEWGPWQEMDKDQVQSLEGTDGEVGSVWKWEGDTVGKGSQTITQMEPFKHVQSELKFMEPMESKSMVDYDLEQMGDSTKLTWKMSGENGFVGRIMGVFMNMDKMIGPDFERGLATLKALAEKEEADRKAELQARTFRGFLIDRVQRPEQTYIGKRATVKFADMDRFLGTTYAATGAAIGTAQLEMSGAPSALYFMWDDAKGRTDFMPAFPVKAGPEIKLPGMDTYTVPASDMLMINMKGGYGQMKEAHTAMDEMIKAKGLTHYGTVVEEYVVSQSSEPDSTKWVTHIYYMVK